MAKLIDSRQIRTIKTVIEFTDKEGRALYKLINGYLEGKDTSYNTILIGIRDVLEPYYGELPF